jgi:hypothetical protein
MRLYVGCSLTHASEEFKQRIDNLKDALRKDFEVLNFLGLVEGTPQDVYQWDIHNCVASCDLFLAVCDFPSLGLGYEMGTAVEKLSKPTLAVAQEESKVGRFFLGIQQPHYSFMRYKNIEDIPALIKEFSKRYTK